MATATTGQGLHAGASRTGLAQVISELAQGLASQSGLEYTLAEIAAAVAAAVPGADCAGIVCATDRGWISVQAPIVLARDALDRFQVECIRETGAVASRDGRVISIPDTAAETRWPEFAARATGLGIGSMLSLRLVLDAERVGALTLYARGSEAFRADDEAIATVFAAHAAIALRDTVGRADLDRAVASRDVIGQAKGLLMHRHHITAARAFDLLVAASQHTNIKLIDVARGLVRDHEDQCHTAPCRIILRTSQHRRRR